MSNDRDSRRDRDPLHRGHDERDVVTARLDDDDRLTPSPVALGRIIAALRADQSMSSTSHDVAEEIAHAIVPMLLERIAKSHQINTNRTLELQQASPESPHTSVRMANLETWRKDTDAWRLKLTGVADSNGRMGNLDRTVAKLREDVGDPSECKAVRETSSAVRKMQAKSWAAVAGAVLAVAGSAWGLVKSRDENIAAAARASQRIDTIERDIALTREDIRIVFQRLPFLGSASTSDQ